MPSESLNKFAYYLCPPVAIGIVAAVAAYQLNNLVDPINAAYAARIDSFRDPSEVEERFSSVLIIGTKGSTPTDLGESETAQVIPRKFHGELAERLEAAGAKGLVFDISFTRPMPQNDALFRKSLARLKKMWVVFGLERKTEDESENRLLGGDSNTGVIAMKPSAILAQGRIPRVHAGSIESTKNLSGELLGIQPIQHDPVSDRPVYHIAYLAKVLQDDPKLESLPVIQGANAIHKKSRTFLEMPENRAMVVRIPESPDVFETVDYADALHELRNGDLKRYRDRIVLVGRVDREEDVHQLPNKSMVTGVVFVAHAVASLETDVPSTRSGGLLVTHVVAFLMAALTSAAFMQVRRSLYVWIPILFLGFLILISTGFLTWIHRQEAFYFGLVILAASTITMAVFAIFERRTDFRAPGMTEDGTVMFLDLIGSTKVVSEIGGEEFQKRMSALNKLFAASLAKHGGILERTTGDGFIAVFRAHRHNDHAVSALECATELVALPETFPNLFIKPEIRFSIGFESGTISGGYVWEGAHRLWSSAGKTVVMAQRIQTFGSRIPNSIFIGPSAYERVAARINVEVHSGILKGFEGETTLYRFKGIKEPRNA